MSRLKLVAVSGGLSRPSRSAALAAAIGEKIATVVPSDVRLLEVADLVSKLPGVISAKDAPQEVSDAVQAIESADALIIATPVYRASYTGLFKHLFDLVHHEALIDTPVLLAATGGSDRHALIIEHELRPLFSFFQALTLPVGVYATDRDFQNYQVVSEDLKARIALATRNIDRYLLARQPVLA
ncbi:FMN reductase [Methylocystis bryophila]|uniref:FMN reductase n=1 Tax=Methylocystis bryophila TaxID=655015 RepID=A0A1W6MS54_9HYPH|nr:FMN reductase [Methylocystis bryophila]ARN80440.1 FMN reductase [Methylocystis bryophila]BDV40452.1 FMN reductase (NADPH) [Methylocystis bryophila]